MSMRISLILKMESSPAKSKAILTDTGGVTSHAAIVSREFGIPCVVGIGDATKVIKTGDLLEVDADQGLITIL